MYCPQLPKRPLASPLQQGAEYLYCVDLEATCDEVGESESPRPLAVVPDQMETIEVGLVVIDLETLEIVDEFQRFVRPQINPILTVFCKKLTSIHQVDVDSARTYVEVGQTTKACDTWPAVPTSGPQVSLHLNVITSLWNPHVI